MGERYAGETYDLDTRVGAGQADKASKPGARRARQHRPSPRSHDDLASTVAGLVAALALGGNCSRTFYGSLRNCAHRRLRRRRKAVGPYRDRKQTIGDLRLDGGKS